MPRKPKLQKEPFDQEEEEDWAARTLAEERRETMAREAREAQGEDWDAAPYVSSDEEEEEEEQGQQTATVAQVHSKAATLLVNVLSWPAGRLG